jgi:hypothetical protein
MDQMNASPKGNWYQLALKRLTGKLYMDQSAEVQLDEG